MIGLAGSVAVGKSTTARVLQQMLAHWPAHPEVALVTTDGFLLPNAELERRGLMHRKGFPESYDRKALLRFVIDIKSGKDEVEAPVYSHLTYDVTDEKVASSDPTSSSSRASTCSSRRRSARTGAPASRSATSSTSPSTSTPPPTTSGSGTPSASCGCARPRSATRRRTSRSTPALSHDDAVTEANRIWDEINGPNLPQNIAPTRSRATLVLRKDHDHSVRWVRLRKL